MIIEFNQKKLKKSLNKLNNNNNNVIKLMNKQRFNFSNTNKI